ncbi:MAG: hypothetical protein DRO40_10105, partial [Thermoprotei archaeon]
SPTKQNDFTKQYQRCERLSKSGKLCYRKGGEVELPFDFRGKCLEAGKTHRFKLVGYKPMNETVKWGLVAGGKHIDPKWIGYAADDFFVKLIKSKPSLTYAEVEYEIANPTGFDIKLPKEALGLVFKEVSGKIERFGTKIYEETVETIRIPVYETVCENVTVTANLTNVTQKVCTRVVKDYKLQQRTVWKEANLTDFVLRSGKRYRVWHKLYYDKPAFRRRIEIDWKPTVKIGNIKYIQHKWTWLNASWNYRREIAVTGQGAGDLTDYQIEIVHNFSSEYSAGKIKQYCEDLRFTYYNATSDTETEIPYWIEECNLTANDNATVWIKVPFTSNTSTETVYMYYGNPDATSESNGTAVFEFFDDFEGTSLDTSKWVERVANGNYIVSDSILKVEGGSEWESIGAKVQFTYGHAFRYYAKMTEQDATIIRMDDRSAGSTQGSDIDASGFGYTSANGKYFFTQREGSMTTSTRTIDLSTWSILEIRWLSDRVDFLINDSLEESHTTNIPLDNCGAQFEAKNTGSTVWVDWALVRKYTDPEPTYEVKSEEYNPNAAILYLNGRTTDVNYELGTVANLSAELIYVGENMIAWWRFDNGSGTVAYDYFKRNNGTIYGATWTEDTAFGKGYALEFDGNDYVKIENSPSLTSFPDYTILLWIYPTGSGHLFTKDVADCYYDLEFSLESDGRLKYQNERGGSQVNLYSTHSVRWNNWNLVGVQYDNSTQKLRFIVNGIIEEQTCENCWIDNSAFIAIGARSLSGDETPTNYFEGIIDEVRIYRASINLMKIMQEFDNIVGYWKFDEAYGTTAYDSSGEGNDGTLYPQPDDPYLKDGFETWNSWIRSRDCQVVEQSSSTVYEGSYSMHILYNTSASTDDYGYVRWDWGTEEDWSDYEYIAFWVYCDNCTDITDFHLILYNADESEISHYPNVIDKIAKNGYWKWIVYRWDEGDNDTVWDSVADMRFVIANSDTGDTGLIKHFYIDHVILIDVDYPPERQGHIVENFDRFKDYTPLFALSGWEEIGNDGANNECNKGNVGPGNFWYFCDGQICGYQPNCDFGMGLTPYYVSDDYKISLRRYGWRDDFAVVFGYDKSTGKGFKVWFGYNNFKIYDKDGTILNSSTTNQPTTGRYWYILNVTVVGNRITAEVFFDNGTMLENGILTATTSYDTSGYVGFYGESQHIIDDLEIIPLRGFGAAKFGSALQFDGVDDYVEVNDSDSLDGFSEATWILWVKIENVADEPDMPLSKVGCYRFVLENSVFKFQFATQDYSWAISFSSDVSYSDYIGKWVMLAVTYTNTTGEMKWFINGELVRTATYSGTITTSNYNLYIGTDLPSSTRFFNGTIDEVRIYNRALSEEEIQNIYEGYTSAVYRRKIANYTICLDIDQNDYGTNYVCGNGTVQYGFTTNAAKNTFSDGSTSKTLAYTSAPENQTVYIRFNKYDLVQSVIWNWTGVESGGSYPTNVTVYINNTSIFKIKQLRSDNVTLDSFSNSKTSETFTLNATTGVTREFDLPIHTNISAAKLTFEYAYADEWSASTGTYHIPVFNTTVIHNVWRFGPGSGLRSEESYLVYANCTETNCINKDWAVRLSHAKSDKIYQWQHEMTNYYSYPLFPSIDIDSKGCIHLVGISTETNPEGNTALAYSYGKKCPGEDWDFSEAPVDWYRDDAGGDAMWYSSAYPVLILDSNDVPHIVYTQRKASGGSKIKYAKKTGVGSWEITTVDEDGFYPAMALDENNHPHIFYLSPWVSCGDTDMIYKWYDGSSWHTVNLTASLVSKPTASYGTAIALDDDFVYFVAVTDYPESRIHYIVRSRSSSDTWATMNWNIITNAAEHLSLYLGEQGEYGFSIAYLFAFTDFQNVTDSCSGINDGGGNFTLVMFKSPGGGATVYKFDSAINVQNIGANGEYWARWINDKGIILGDEFDQRRKCDANCTPRFYYLTTDDGSVFDIKYGEIVFPKDPQISINGHTVWSYNGLFDSSQEIDLNTTLFQEFVNSCSNNTFVCSMPISFSATNYLPSKARVENINITYTYDFNPFELNTTLIQNYLDNLEPGSYDVPIHIQSETNGTIVVNALNITYYGTDTVPVTAHPFGSSEGDTLSAHVYYSRFNYSFPKNIEYIEFIPKTPSDKNVPAFGQTWEQPILNFTVLAYDKPVNLSIKINETFPCVNLTASSTNAKSEGRMLNGSWFTFATNLSQFDTASLWMWADFDCSYAQWYLWNPEFYFRA